MPRVRKLNAEDLEGRRLRSLLNAAGQTRRKAKIKSHTLADQEMLYGARYGVELRALLRMRETHALEKLSIGDFRPFHFLEPFHLKGRNAANKHLVRAPKLGWPVWLNAHFWALYPIGASQGGDFLLAHSGIDGQAGSTVYRYDHETGELKRHAVTISELVARSLDGAEAAVRAFTKRKQAKARAVVDPIKLERRSRWLTEILLGQAPSDLERELGKHAPSTRVFGQEVGALALATHPHLALYWLFAHTILRNKDSFEQTFEQTAASKHAFVASARDLCRHHLAGSAALGSLDAHAMERMRRLLADAPSRVLDRRVSATRSRARRNQRAKVAEALATEGPFATIAAHPDDLRLHIRCLKDAARSEGAAFKKAVSELSQWSKRGTKPGEGRALLTHPDTRLAPTLRALLRAGHGFEWHEERANEMTVPVLAKIGTAEAFEALIAEYERRGYNLRVVRRMTQALAKHPDSRVDQRLKTLVTNLTKKELRGFHSSVYEEWCLDILEVYLQRNHGKAEATWSVVKDSLSDEAGYKTKWVKRVARFVEEEKFKRAKPLLKKISSNRGWKGYSRVVEAAERALAQLD